MRRCLSQWDVAGHGDRFLINTAATDSEPLTVVLNWTSALKNDADGRDAVWSHDTVVLVGSGRMIEVYRARHQPPARCRNQSRALWPWIDTRLAVVATTC
jgi:hypothetical protein